jgi:hypothetical protein
MPGCRLCICPLVAVRHDASTANPTPGALGGTVRIAMQDVVMLLFTVAFFALAFFYVKACQKLR